MWDVAVIGGGISGLLAAFMAVQARKSVTLIEQSDRLGGLMGTYTINGFRLETGPNSFPSSAAHLLSLCEQLNLTPQPVDSYARFKYLVRHGRLEAAPTGPLSALNTPLLPTSAKLRLLLEPFQSRLLRAEDSDCSVADFVRHRLGEPLLDNVLAPLLTGIYAGDPESLSLRAVFPVMAEWETASGSVIRGALKSRKNAQSKARPAASARSRQKRQILGFPGGMQTLLDALISQLVDRPDPVSICLNASVNRLARLKKPGGGWAVYLNTQTGATPIEAQKLVMAVNAHQAADLLSPLYPEAAEALNAIPYAPVTVLHLGYRRQDVGHPLDGFGFLVPPKAQLPLLGCIFASSLFPNRAPEGHVLLTVMVGGMLGKALTTLSDEALLQQVLAALGPLLHIKPQSPPVLCHRIDWPKAIPQLTLGHLGRWRRIMACENDTLQFACNYGEGVALEHIVQRAYR